MRDKGAIEVLGTKPRSAAPLGAARRCAAAFGLDSAPIIVRHATSANIRYLVSDRQNKPLDFGAHWHRGRCAGP
jgi:hypothetical protein